MMVGIPNSKRAGMMYFIAGCMFLAKRKTIPVWSNTLPNCAGLRSILIPKACKTSAEPDLEVTARSTDDQAIMGIQHKNLPIYGLQYHPESIGTPDGLSSIQNFIEKVVK